jgi:predicted enzyme related to lactoylglutathione lyase
MDKRTTIKEDTMSKKAKAKPKAAKKNRVASSIVWFEIPADNPERAKKFYGSLFGWNIKLFPGMTEYWHIDTGGSDDTPDGGMIVRKHPEQPITNYVSVKSVTGSLAKVEKLGGKVCMPKTAVPQMGYFAICQDTENNMFALWEMSASAK